MLPALIDAFAVRVAVQGWFLKFAPNITYHVPQCDNNFNPPKCTEFYHDQDQVQCGCA